MINIGYFQFKPEFLQVRNNLREIEKLLQKNRKIVHKLDLVIFPEYFLSGPIKLDFLPEYEREVSSRDIEISLKEISKKYPRTAFVMGSVLLKKDRKYFNTSLALKNGRILAKYHKKALIYYENYFCQSDNKKAIFKLKGIRIGLAVCWDLILPEIFRKYIRETDLVIIPSFWGIAGNPLQAKYSFSLEKKYYSALGISRAYENAYAILFINSVGRYKSPFYSDRMMGGSYFVIPPLGLVHKTNNKNPNILHTLKFNLEPLNQYREFYATDKDYFYYLARKVI